MKLYHRIKKGNTVTLIIEKSYLFKIINFYKTFKGTKYAEDTSGFTYYFWEEIIDIRKETISISDLNLINNLNRLAN